MSKQAMETDWIDRVVQDVAELSDRDSPEDWPEAMLVTGDELRQIIDRRAKEAIKQHDAEPVGEVVVQGINVSTARMYGSFPQGTKVYTSAPSIPEGWQLVPKEPTAEMMEKYRTAFISSERFDGASVYKAMLAASPKPK